MSSPTWGWGGRQEGQPVGGVHKEEGYKKSDAFLSLTCWPGPAAAVPKQGALSAGLKCEGGQVNRGETSCRPGASLVWQTLGTQLSSPGLVLQNQDSKTEESPEVSRKWAFVAPALRCHALFCCWVTHKQKSVIVALVKKYQNVVTLAIGDGTDDVNMIKSGWWAPGLGGRPAAGWRWPRANMLHVSLQLRTLAWGWRARRACRQCRTVTTC